MIVERIWSPSIELSYVKTKFGEVAVVRDDLLEGGTKQRAAVPFVCHMMDRGLDEFIYASPFSGYAQIALAVACRVMGAKCVIYAEQCDGMSTFSRLASDKGAKVVLCDSLDEAQRRAKEYAQAARRFNIPLGFNDPIYKDFLRKELKHQWDVLSSLQATSRLWLPVGSGTLADTFRSFLPTSVKLCCVDVRVLSASDHRIKRVRNLQNTVYWASPESFSQAAVNNPPLPSNCYYDAKLWQFVYEHAFNGDVWWNVAA